MFEKSLQGDIIAIYDNTTAKVVTYTYDAWGNTTISGTKANTIGTLNPFRYRGYYFDTETSLYYVNSRYYNAEWGRFLNVDSYVTTGQGLVSFNMFAYCLNDPINRMDAGGATSVEIYDNNRVDLMGTDLYDVGGGSAYSNYLVRSGTAAYDGSLGGYYTGSLPSTYYNLGSYYVPGAVSVDDSMASQHTKSTVSPRKVSNPNGSHTGGSKRGSLFIYSI